jgi:PAS domain S-box-containing protein
LEGSDPRAKGVEGAVEDHSAIAENALFGVGTLQEDGRWLAADPLLVRLLGYERDDDLLALDAADFYVNPVAHEWLMAAWLRNGGGSSEASWLRRDKSRVVVRMTSIRSSDHDPRSFDVIVEDITDRKAWEGRLRQAQKMEAIGQLTSGIAHDFNNILTIVMSTADLLVRQLPLDAVGPRADLDDLQRAARQGAEMIGTLMSLSRNDESRLRPLDAGEALQDMCRTLRRLLPQHIELEVKRRKEDDLTVEADPTAIQQILLNLSTNARDAMMHGGRLTFQVERGQGRALRGTVIRIAVTDTGMGMDAATRERLFEPFFTTKEVGRGTGLGLSMVSGIVRQHRGAISVDSELGTGTTVSIELPASSRACEVAAPRPLERPEASTEQKGIQVLIAEDEIVISRVAKRVLEQHGYSVSLVGDGAEALDWLGLHGSDVDLVIADLSMPRLGGLALYSAARAQGVSSRFLFMSGHLGDDARATLEQDGVGFLAKPWTIAELVSSVQQALTEGEGR